MGQKKNRNIERNKQKELARRQRVDQQNKTHDASIFADAMVMTAEVRSRPSDEDYPYSAQRVQDALDRYKIVDATHIFIQMEQVPVPIDPVEGKVIEDVALEWRGVMYANHPVRGQEVIAYGKSYVGKSYSQSKCLSDFPNVALKQEDGRFVWPYYDERKAKILREAEEKRARVRAKLAVTMAVGLALGGSQGDI